MPLVALTHDIAKPPPDAPPALAEALGDIWHELQRDLAGLVPNARQIIAEQSGHMIRRDQPRLVIEAIGEVVEAARRVASATLKPAP